MATGPSKIIAILLMLLIGALLLTMPVSGKIPADTDAHFTPLHYLELKEETVAGPYLQFIGEDGRYYWGKLIVSGTNQSLDTIVSQGLRYCTHPDNDQHLKRLYIELTTNVGR